MMDVDDDHTSQGPGTPLTPLSTESEFVEIPLPDQDLPSASGPNGKRLREELETESLLSNSPKVTKTYGKKNRTRGKDKASVTITTPIQRTLARTRSSTASKAEVTNKGNERKRQRSISPSSTQRTKQRRTLPPLKKSKSVTSLRSKFNATPLTQRTTTEPIKTQVSKPVPTLGAGSDSDLTPPPASPALEIAETPFLASRSLPKASSSRKNPSRASNAQLVPASYLDTLGVFVFVLVHPQSGRLCNDGQEGLWWPSKIINKQRGNTAARVELYGRGKVSIMTPCVDNIRSAYDSNGRQQFKEPTFETASSRSSLESPRKKSKHEHHNEKDLVRQWNEALTTMLEDANKDESDNLPDVFHMFDTPSIKSTPPISLLTSEDEAKPTDSTPITKQRGKGKGRGKRKLEEIDQGPDETLEIPGELVFARDRDPLYRQDPVTTVLHWGARIQEYVPPTKPGEVGKYGIVWMTGEYGLVRRDQMYIMSEPEFSICKLGQIDSTQGACMEKDISGTDFSRRSPSPGAGPVPEKGHFIGLPIRQQFAYTKPVLKAILLNEYKPLKQVQDDFFSGKKTRNWNEHASRKGNMLEDHVETLSVYLKEWVLRSRLQNRVDKADLTSEEVNPKALPGAEEIVAHAVVVAQDAEKVVHKPTDHPALAPATVCAGQDADMEPKTEGRSSPPMTELAPSSPPPLPPPSSLLSISTSQSSLTSEVDADNDELAPDSLPGVGEASSKEEQVREEVDRMEIDGDHVELPLLPETSPTVLKLPLPSESVASSAGRPAPPRQVGGPEYEAMHLNKKICYVMDVLLVELVRQILIWRSGQRTSIELLSDEEEERLFGIGETLLESDWVLRLMKTRESRAVDTSTPTPSGRRRNRKSVDYRDKN